MSSFTKEVVQPVSVGLLDSNTWSSYLRPRSKTGQKIHSLHKRQVVTIPDSFSMLVGQCNLNNVQGSDVAASCVAAIYKNFCYNPTDTQLLRQCHNAYNAVFSNSFFKSLGDVCPAWKRGPRSSACTNAISTFSYHFYIGKDNATGQDTYLTLGSSHATQMVKNIFGSKIYAPCPYPAPACNW
jgi:hypothetical protein